MSELVSAAFGVIVGVWAMTWWSAEVRRLARELPGLEARADRLGSRIAAKRTGRRWVVAAVSGHTVSLTERPVGLGAGTVIYTEGQ